MLPRRTLSAIAAVVDVARLARSKPVPARTLAARYELAPRQFETLLQDLVRFGILKSLRGPHGGYELARERRRISLGDIVRAIGAVRPGGQAAAGRLVAGVIEPALAQATAAFLASLDGVSVEDLCRRAAASGDGEGGGEADFHI